MQQQLTLCVSGVDYTKIPKQLDAKFEELDEDSALRPTIIKPGTLWTHKSQKVSEQLRCKCICSVYPVMLTLSIPSMQAATNAHALITAVADTAVNSFHFEDVHQPAKECQG